jgi:kynurenine formamidase
MAELYDLAHTMRTEAMEAAAIEIDYLDHAPTARRLARELGVPVAELGLDGMFEAEEMLTVGTHFGTHLDAPSHYADEFEGRRARTVDEMPLGPLFPEAVTLDFSQLGPEAITAARLEAALAAVGHELEPGEIVITRVGVAERYRDEPGIRDLGAGLDRSGIDWLLEHGIRFTATDSMTQDLPIPWMERRFREGDRDAYFPVHLAGKRTDYVHVEKAAGLGSLPGPHGYRVAAFPIKVEGGSGAWTRFHALRALPFDPAAVDVLDLAQPIRRESMERRCAEIRTHGAARRQRQWAKHLGVPVGEVEARGSWDQVVAATSAGTHLAAPARFGPEVEGRPARTVPDVPLEWCFGPGVVLDVRDGARDEAIDRAEIVAALATSGHTLGAGDIVLLLTGAEDRFDGDLHYPDAGRGLAVDALEHFVERGVRLIGTDAESLDRPRPAMVADARAGDPAALFPILRAARRLEHCQLLQVGGLEALARTRPSGFWVDAAPIKVEGAGSGWCRPAAFVPRP